MRELNIGAAINGIRRCWLLLFAALVISSPPPRLAHASVFAGSGWGWSSSEFITSGSGSCGAGLSTLDTNTVNYFNPAGNSGARFTRLQQSIGLESTRSWSNNAHFNDVMFDFSGSAITFPVLGVNLGFLLMPYSSPASMTHTRGQDSTFLTEDDDDNLVPTAFYESLHRSGGIYKIKAFAAWSWKSRLHLGVGLSRIGGDVRSIWTLNYSMSAPPWDTQVIQEEDLTGWQPSFGLVFQPWQHLQLGLAYEPAVSVRDRIRIKNVSIGTDQITYEEDIDFPSQLVAGVQYRWGKWQFMTDLVYRNTGETRLETGTLADERLGYFAGALRRGVNLSTHPWWDRLTYTAGFSLIQSETLVLDERVNELSLALGVGIPNLKHPHLVNTGIIISNRGDLDTHDLQEYTLRGYVSITFKERWFVQPPKR